MTFPLAAALPSLIGGAFGLLSSRNQPDQVQGSTGGRSNSINSTQLDPRLGAAGALGLQQAQDLFGQGGIPVAGLGGNFFNAQRATDQFLNQNPQTQNQFAQGGPQFGSNPFATGGPQNIPGSNPFASGGIQNTFGTGAGDNQFLQSAFDRAANLTQPRLATEFSGAGRNVGAPAHQTLRGDELGAISANLLLPLAQQQQSLNFAGQEANLGRRFAGTESNLNRGFGATEANIGRQFAGTEGNLAREQSGLTRQFNAQEGNLGRQLGAAPVAGNLAQVLQQNDQQRFNQPAQNINQFLGQAGAASPFFNTSQTQSTNQTGTTTQPVFNDPLGSAAGGALLGQTLFPDGFDFGRQQPLQRFNIPQVQPFNFGAPQNFSLTGSRTGNDLFGILG